MNVNSGPYWPFVNGLLFVLIVAVVVQLVLVVLAAARGVSGVGCTVAVIISLGTNIRKTTKLKIKQQNNPCERR
jgi:hypothetical protein